MDTTTQSKSVGYHMPVLIYSSNALTPVISQATVELHFDKHLRAYIGDPDNPVRNILYLKCSTTWCIYSVFQLFSFFADRGAAKRQSVKTNPVLCSFSTAFFQSPVSFFQRIRQFRNRTSSV